MMNREFVPYEQAKALKELGFDESCLATIDQTGYVHINGTKEPIRGSMVYFSIKLPTWKHAFRWFREKYKLHSKIDVQDVELDFYCYEILEVKEGKYMSDLHIDMNFKFYEEAELECLKKLIELVTPVTN